MSENTLNAALRRLGYASDEMTAHGFRAMASTLLNESGKFHPDAIERALAHGDDDKVRAAYHRGAHWGERVAMAQWWAEASPSLKASLLRICHLTPGDRVDRPFVPEVRDAVLRTLLASASRYVMLPIQDVFGWDARVNTPATVSDANWTWRVPVLMDTWRDSPEWVERAAALTGWSRESRRL